MTAKRSFPRGESRRCKGCTMTVLVPHGHKGAPDGWFNITESVPGRNGAPYRYRGQCCSTACLVGVAMSIHTGRCPQAVAS